MSWDDDDDWGEDPIEDPGDALVRTAWRFLGWRRSVRRRVGEVRAVWQDHDLNVDWIGFATTKGAFSGGYDTFLGGFLRPMPKYYEVVVGKPGEMVATGGWCAPVHAEPTWQPWARYYPPLRPTYSYAQLIPTFNAERGGIRYGMPSDG